jgi:5-methylcytosine-specific restriction enzyme A
METIKRSPWDHWYGLGRWRRRQRAQLLRFPLCAMCLDRGRVVPATIAHHVTPHRGDWNKFILGDLQSLCKPCHDSPVRIIEARGYSTAVGEDGWPIDPKHPCYR